MRLSPMYAVNFLCGQWCKKMQIGVAACGEKKNDAFLNPNWIRMKSKNDYRTRPLLIALIKTKQTIHLSRWNYKSMISYCRLHGY